MPHACFDLVQLTAVSGTQDNTEAKCIWLWTVVLSAPWPLLLCADQQTLAVQSFQPSLKI